MEVREEEVVSIELLEVESKMAEDAELPEEEEGWITIDEREEEGECDSQFWKGRG
jgi:hypothetical protein